MRRHALIASATVALLSVTACGTTEPPKPSDRGPAVTVTDDRGPQHLAHPAERVVVLQWSYAEDLLAVGVTPVGVAQVKEYDTWVKAAPLPAGVKDVGLRQQPSLDAVAGLDPDLVIGDTSSTCGKTLGQFERIAKVLCFDGTDAKDNFGYMRRTFTAIAGAVGKAAEAKRRLAALDAKLATAKERLASAGRAGTSFACAQGWTDQGAPVVRMFGRGSLAVAVGERLGLRNAWHGRTDDWGLTQTDVEGLTKLGNTQFVYVAPVDNVFTTSLPKNRIWRNLPFVKDEHVHALDGGTWLFGGPLSMAQFADELVKALS
ncbi:MAG TPA: iron-siderophore ABC transporter substrate-binding protein [Streptosporangiales bacterium]